MRSVRRCWVLLLLLLGCGGASYGQVPLRDMYGRQLGWHVTAFKGAPRVILLPEREGDEQVRLELARRLAKLECNVWIPEMPPLFYNPHASVDTLLLEVRRAIDAIYPVDNPREVIIVGSRRSATLALMASGSDFRIKQAVLLSPGNYFASRAEVAAKVSRVRMPSLVLYTPRESRSVRGLCEGVPSQYVVYSPTLRTSSYRDLLGVDTVSGAAWLALSIFYEQR